MRRVVVYDAGQDSVDLAIALTDAQFPVRAERATRGTLAASPGDAIGGVQIQLALRGLGWLEMRLRVNAGSLVLPGSYLSDAWKETLTALTGLLRGAAETRVVWIEEPGSYRFAFSVRDHGVLSVKVFYLADDLFGTATPAGDGELVLDATVRLADLAMAFAGASRSLLAAVPDIDVRARWPYGPASRAAGDRSPPRSQRDLARHLTSPGSTALVLTSVTPGSQSPWLGKSPAGVPDDPSGPG